MEEAQRIYSPGDLSSILEINPSTLRKYADLLEKKGYKFHKNEFGHRGYYDRDVIALRKLMSISKNKDMTLESSAISVVSWTNLSEIASTATTEPLETNDSERYSEQLNSLQEFAIAQMQFNQELLKRLDDQQRYIENSLKARDSSLLESIRDMQSEKLAIANASKPFLKRFIEKIFKIT